MIMCKQSKLITIILHYVRYQKYEDMQPPFNARAKFKNTFYEN